MTLRDKIENILKEGSVLELQGGIYVVFGTILAPMFYLSAAVTNNPETHQVSMFGGHVSGIHILVGATTYAVGKYYKNRRDGQK